MYLKNNFKVVLGSYVEAHNDLNITKNITKRTHKCISIRSTGNTQGYPKVVLPQISNITKDK